MRGLFYCQHLAGIGHLVRSLNICKSLVKGFDIDFVQGGGKAPLPSIPSTKFHPLQLPPIAYVPGKGISDPEGKLGLSELHLERKNRLLSTFTGAYEFLITEFFPFSKLDFDVEIVPLIQQVKQQNPECLIISCVRDVMSYVLKAPEVKTCTLLNRFYDKVFVNSDPSIIKLEDSFRLSPEIEKMIFYTGYVAEPESPIPVQREKAILVSMGGGLRGEELLRLTASISVNFPDYRFVFALGPHSPPALSRHLHEFAEKYRSPNIEVSPFIPDLESTLSRCCLSISTGGYNTMMNVIHTQTPAIVYPVLLDEEQNLRARKMAEKGLVHAIYPQELQPEPFSKLIRKALHAPYPRLKIDLNGAEHMLQELQRLIMEKQSNG